VAIVGDCGALWAIAASLLCGYYGVGSAAQIGAYCGQYGA